MLGGGIREYRPEGASRCGHGRPEAQQCRRPGEVLRRDALRGGDSAGRVLQYDAASNFVREFKTGCGPHTLALDGDWLDGSCEDRLFTINLKSRSIKRLRLPGQVFRHPTSVAHGPDHALYVLDSGILQAFRVDR